MSLVVIMGLTWIFGVLVVEVEALLPLTYIYTIMVAFQGLFIFIIFVASSKSVREAYLKWWRAKVNESDTLSKYFGEHFSSSSSKNVSTILNIVNYIIPICLDLIPRGTGYNYVMGYNVMQFCEFIFDAYNIKLVQL